MAFFDNQISSKKTVLKAIHSQNKGNTDNYLSHFENIKKNVEKVSISLLFY